MANGSTTVILDGGYDNTTVTPDDYDGVKGFYFYENIENLRKPWVAEPHFVPLVIIYGSVFLLGIIGNVAVLFAVMGGRTSRSVTFSFMVNLAVSDILFLLVCVPHEALRMVLGQWGGDRAFCKISGFIEMLTTIATILNLTAVSFERYFVIVMPLRSRRCCTFGNSRKILVALWIFASILAAPSFYVKDTEIMTYYNNDSSINMLFCADNGLTDTHKIFFAIYQLLVMFAIPTILMIYCYTVVIYVLWISRRTLSSLTPNSRKMKKTLVKRNSSFAQDSEYSDSDRLRKCSAPSSSAEVRDSILKGRKQVIRMLVTLIVVFLVCWGPKLILQLAKRVNPNIYFLEVFNLQIAVYCLPYIQSCTNPLIYCGMSKTFRQSFRTACTRLVNKFSLCRRHNLSTTELELETRTTTNWIKKPFAINRCSTSSD